MIYEPRCIPSKVAHCNDGERANPETALFGSDGFRVGATSNSFRYTCPHFAHTSQTRTAHRSTACEFFISSRRIARRRNNDVSRSHPQLQRRVPRLPPPTSSSWSSSSCNTAVGSPHATEFQYTTSTYLLTEVLKTQARSDCLQLTDPQPVLRRSHDLVPAATGAQLSNDVTISAPLIYIIHTRDADGASILSKSQCDTEALLTVCTTALR